MHSNVSLIDMCMVSNNTYTTRPAFSLSSAIIRPTKFHQSRLRVQQMYYYAMKSTVKIIEMSRFRGYCRLRDFETSIALFELVSCNFTNCSLEKCVRLTNRLDLGAEIFD